MVQHHVEHFRRQRRCLQGVGPELRMVPHHDELVLIERTGLLQDAERNAGLADVVQESRGRQTDPVALTDPEMLEFRYPVVLEDFHIRKGSGGKGKWHAGDGVRRTIRFLEKMECTILSGHRRVPPFGLAGGEPGEVGENWARRKDGRMQKLQGCDDTVLDADEAVIIQTPTAGGYGTPGS